MRQILLGLSNYPWIPIRLNKFVLSKMHPLYNVTTVIEYFSDIVSVYGTGKMWITIVSTITACRAYPLQKTETNDCNTCNAITSCMGSIWSMHAY